MKNIFKILRRKKRIVLVSVMKPEEVNEKYQMIPRPCVVKTKEEK